MDFWTAQLQKGTAEQAVLAAIAGSDEFFTRPGQPASETPPALPAFKLSRAFQAFAGIDDHTTFDVVSVEGLTDPGVQVTLGDQTTFADFSGRFRFDEVPLEIGDNSLLATATDVTGRSSSFEAVVTREGSNATA